VQGADVSGPTERCKTEEESQRFWAQEVSVSDKLPDISRRGKKFPVSGSFCTIVYCFR